jgi:hypothetical protein
MLIRTRLAIILLLTSCDGRGDSASDSIDAYVPRIHKRCIETCKVSSDCCVWPISCDKYPYISDCYNGYCRGLGCRNDSDCKEQGASSKCFSMNGSYSLCRVPCSESQDCRAHLYSQCIDGKYCGAPGSKCKSDKDCYSQLPKHPNCNTNTGLCECTWQSCTESDWRTECVSYTL